MNASMIGAFALTLTGCGSTKDSDTGSSHASEDEHHSDINEPQANDTGTAPATDTGGSGDTGGPGDTGEPDPEPFAPNWPDGTDPFADAVVSFEPGPDAGFGSEGFPEIVLGAPGGRGTSGSLDVLSLGELGSITLEMVDLAIYDGPGPDLIVFENAFGTWAETGRVEVSSDGVEWAGWTCEAENADDNFPGCAGVNQVYATSEFLVDPTDPLVAGGDAFDLADIGVTEARFVRITDSGYNALGYGGETGGFDLDAVGAANWMAVPDAAPPEEAP